MLTEAQKITVLRVLCYPLGTIDSTSMDYNTVTTRKLAAIDGAGQTEVEKVLAWIDETETQLDTLIAQNNVKKVDDIEFFENPTKDLRKERSRYISDLASLIGIPCRCRSGVNVNVIC